MSKTRQLAIDTQTADRITVLNLKDYRSYLKKELQNYKAGEWLHPDDVAMNMQVIEAINLVIKQYGDE